MQIDGQLLARVHRKHIVKQFDVSAVSLKGHWRNHLNSGKPIDPPASDPEPDVLSLPPDRLDDHLKSPAPVCVSKGVGLPAGATYGQCLREALLRSAIAGDTSAAKELLERLEGPGDKSER